MFWDVLHSSHRLAFRWNFRWRGAILHLGMIFLFFTRNCNMADVDDGAFSLYIEEDEINQQGHERAKSH
ncbi:hypothetical protein DT065_08850 [Salicibibacter kimchii]|uniref:Uncharacterized protein n=1 Tax=Salicibibacter kimchii TaxID=2099786 RepID=A0A345BYU0_9BACI|nr:hypothetical protein DT065_08850 [Salicibibacter kimchii]